jgi:hypothetical protein
MEKKQKGIKMKYWVEFWLIYNLLDLIDIWDDFYFKFYDPKYQIIRSTQIKNIIHTYLIRSFYC